MKKQNVLIIAVALFAIIAAVTNPDITEHQQAVKNKVNEKLQKALAEKASTNATGFESLGQNLGAMLGNAFIDRIVESAVTSDNYVLFSTTKITWKGESKTIGFGLFGNVFISSQISEALKGNSGN